MEGSARSRPEWSSCKSAPVCREQGLKQMKFIFKWFNTISPTLLTWMSSSLELNSDTSTFSPSDTLVRETHSLPDAWTCASEGRSRSRPPFITLTKLKVGCRGPRFLFLASFATSITSSQHLAGNREKKRRLRRWDSWPQLWINREQRTTHDWIYIH